MSAAPNRKTSQPPRPPIHTENPAMLDLIEYSRRMARTCYPVLIQGETGTGKELMAREIHATSGRCGPFVPINCGAIPETLFEAELFGAKRGAYTGLDADRRGLFRLAEEGTLFLDEIGEMPASVQAKLLRTLQDGEVRALGSTDAELINTRIVLATHKDLQQMVADKAFRPDLYYRISAFRLCIPPLRERPEDIRTLLLLAVAEAARHQGVKVPVIQDKVFELALRYPWPGNVREVMHAAANAVLQAQGEEVCVAHFTQLDRRSRQEDRPGGPPEGSPETRIATDRPFFEALAVFERDYISALLKEADFNLTRAADRAKLSRSSLRTKAHMYGLLGNDPGRGALRNRVRRGTLT